MLKHLYSCSIEETFIRGDTFELLKNLKEMSQKALYIHLLIAMLLLVFAIVQIYFTIISIQSERNLCYKNMTSGLNQLEIIMNDNREIERHSTEEIFLQDFCLFV